MEEHKMYDNLSNECEKGTNTDEEMITINKSKLVDYISTLMGVVFIFGVCIGSTINLLITHFFK